jgi:histidine phosphotransferase ChpT
MFPCETLHLERAIGNTDSRMRQRDSGKVCSADDAEQSKAQDGSVQGAFLFLDSLKERHSHMTAIQIDGLDLAALLCSRVCHDVISPVGAIVNGLEVMEDPAMAEFALELIKKSARQASARLQFARIAFGAAGSAGAMIDTGDAANVAMGFLNDEKLTLTWDAPRALLPKNQVKLLLNLLIISTGAIPRGGQLALNATIEGEQGRFVVIAKGPHARIPAHVEALLAGAPETGVVDAHAIQPFYTGMIARAAGMHVHMAIDGETVTLVAEKTEAPATS